MHLHIYSGRSNTGSSQEEEDNGTILIQALV
jgi:hypothetical protein